MTVRGASPDQALVVGSGDQTLARGTGFVTWVLPATGGSPPGPTVAAGAADGGAVSGCFVDLSAASAPVEGVSLAPPRVAWGGPTRLEGAGTFGGRIGVEPAPLASGSPIPDGVVCIAFGAPTTSSDTAHVTVAEQQICHPAGEPFAVAASLVVDRTQNADLQVVVPYTVTHRAVGSSEDVVVATGQTELPTFALTKPADPVTGVLLTVGILLLSALLPLALLVCLINLQRRLPDPSTRDGRPSRPALRRR